MIVTCPNCGAQYRLPDAVSVVGKRMRCADCEHRWTIEAPLAPVLEQADEPAAVTGDGLTPGPDEIAAAPIPEVVTPELPAPETPVIDEAPDDHDDDTRRGFGWPFWLAGLVVLLVAGFVGLVALGRIDAQRVPLVGDLLAGMQPQASPLVIEATAQLTPLPGGALLLEVSGVVRNTGRSRVDVSALKAMLGGEGNVARRWTIALPVSKLAPGETAPFASTLTDVPGGARQVRLVTG